MFSSLKGKFTDFLGMQPKPKGPFGFDGSNASLPEGSMPSKPLIVGMSPLPNPEIKFTALIANVPPNAAPAPAQVLPNSQLLRLICLVAHKDEDLTQAGATFGCAFAIGGGWFMTAHHVLPDLESLRHHRAIFYPENGERETATPTYDSKSFFASADGIRSENGFDYTLDYAVFHVASHAQDGAWICSNTSCSTDDVVDILRPVRATSDGQAPVVGFGVVKTVSTNATSGPFDRVMAVDASPIFFHNCSSWGGDSGSPIMNDRWQVVGLHTHGFQKHFDGNKARFNWGSHISAGADDLKRRAPDIYKQCVALHATIGTAQAHPTPNPVLFVEGTQ